jgi:tricorn protease-like protein
MFPLLPIAGLSLLVVGTLFFWSAVQNWLADLIAGAPVRFAGVAHTLQNVLVVVDRAVVNGQRVAVVTGRAVFMPKQAPATPLVIEEQRQVRYEDLPADVAAKLDALSAGKALEYELSTMRFTAKTYEPTYRLVVRRAQ